MAASISQLVPQGGSYVEALVAFRAARLHDCVSQLRGVATTAARTLRARALLRLGSAARALAALNLDDSTTSRDRGEVALLRAVASSRIGNSCDARDALREAFVFGVSSADTALETEVEFYRALMSFGSGDLRSAEAACFRSLDAAETAPAFATCSGAVPLAHVVSRTEELLGILGLANGNFLRAQHYAQTALATLDASGTRDAYQEAFALKNLANLASNYDSTEFANALISRVRTFEWTHEIARPRFATLENLGWCAALRGDVAGALRSFRDASEIADIVPEFASIAIDRALVAREAGHHGMVAEEVDYAVRRSSEYDWNEAPGDYRTILLSIAQAAAGISPIDARKMLDIHSRIESAMDATFVARIEPRFRAEEAYAHGLVLRAERRLAASTERLQDAFAIWTRIGFEWRAARAALELAELDAGDVFRLAVRQELKRRPASIFSERARLVA